jgi:hypothetical protein
VKPKQPKKTPLYLKLQAEHAVLFMTDPSILTETQPKTPTANALFVRLFGYATMIEWAFVLQ